MLPASWTRFPSVACWDALSVDAVSVIGCCIRVQLYAMLLICAWELGWFWTPTLFRELFYGVGLSVSFFLYFGFGIAYLNALVSRVE